MYLVVLNNITYNFSEDCKLCWQEANRREIMLGYNKNYTTLALDYILKNSKRMILVSGIKRRDRNNNIREK